MGVECGRPVLRPATVMSVVPLRLMPRASKPRWTKLPALKTNVYRNCLAIAVCSCEMCCVRSSGALRLRTNSKHSIRESDNMLCILYGGERNSTGRRAATTEAGEHRYQVFTPPVEHPAVAAQ